MKNTLLDKDYENAYNRKKKNSEERGIGFEFSLEEYTAIMKARSSFKCGYTGQDLVLNKGFEHRDYPEMDRVDENKSYNRHNILFCGKHVHKLKTQYVELGKSRKGLSHNDLCILRSIDKVLSQPDILESRQQPYQNIFDQVKQKEYNELAKEEEEFRKNETRTRQENITKAKEKVDLQREKARHYLKIVETLESCGIVYALSTKEHRDVFRVKRDQITGKEFDTYSEKFMWITDKKNVQASGIVTAKDFIVVYADTQVLLDNMEQLGDTKTILSNLIKRI